MSKEQFQIARELINEKKYNEAREILRKIDDPTARKWLGKIDQIDPPSSGKSGLIYVLGLGTTFIVGIVVGGLFFGNRPVDIPANNVAASIPTEVVLPSLVPTDTPPAPTNTATNIPTPTLTATSSDTPSPTYTLTITSTPLPTDTPIPTNTLTPTVPPQSAQIGPIHDSLYDESFSVQVDLLSVEFSPGEGYEKPRRGNEYMIVEMKVHNLGPGTLRSIGSPSFQVKDANGAIRDYTYVLFRECEFDLVDLTANGNITGCVAFEIPQDGTLELIYAPFQYEGLEPGRYIAFKVR